jgi:hypothetical protein
MRGLLALALLALLTSGCTEGPDPSTDSGSPAETPMEAAPLPEPIHASETVSASADPTNVAGICMAPTAQCFEYPFELERDANVTVALAWGLPSNDFDLYLDGDQRIGSSAASPPGTQESIAASLDAGSYVVTVTGYAVAQDTFTLDVTFT